MHCYCNLLQWCRAKSRDSSSSLPRELIRKTKACCSKCNKKYFKLVLHLPLFTKRVLRVVWNLLGKKLEGVHLFTKEEITKLNDTLQSSFQIPTFAVTKIAVHLKI